MIYDRRDFLLAALLIGFGTTAHAQEKYPTRPIRLLVPFPAGGPVDVMGRLIAQRLSSTIGQQVILENRPGAGSTLAGRAAAGADVTLPDRHGTTALGHARTRGYSQIARILENAGAR